MSNTPSLGPLHVASLSSPICPNCGRDFADFSRSGKIGCSVCYEVFHEQLEPILRRVHGTSSHTGKVPVKAGNAVAAVESVKAASDVYAPVGGKVLEVNEALADKPETINEDAYGDGWLFVVELADAEQLNELLGPDDYAELLESDDH